MPSPVLTMTQAEHDCAQVLSEVCAGKLTMVAAAEMLGLSERHLYRKLGRFRSQGDAGLIHRLRGRPSNRGYLPSLKMQVQDLYWRLEYRDYITDRQMDFRRAWNVGGYVFSNMIQSVCRSDDLSLLDPGCPDRSFFIRSRDYCDEVQHTLDNEGYLFVGRKRNHDNRKMSEYGFTRGALPFFRPRYYPSDFRSILNI